MSFLFPAWCFHCRTFINRKIKSQSPFLCQSCFQSLPRFDSTICLKCGRSHDPKSCQAEWAKHITRFYSVFSYEDPIKTWISSLKYNRNFTAGRMMQHFIKDWFSTNQEVLKDIDSIIPIPIHLGRLNQRGFNQSVYLLNRQNQLKLNLNVLKKRTRTTQQAGKTKAERKDNLKNAFRITDKIKGGKVLLFDDVCTTGQTLAEASKILKKSGAEQIDALVLSRSLNVI